jgi:type IV pilus assembly protein PilX
MITTTSTHPYGRQHGMALITAMLLLLVITILGVAMFRSNGLEQRIGGNTRDKERAFHAANADLAVAEQHLIQNNGVNATTGSACTGVMSVSSTVSLVCSNAIQSDVQDVPWPSYVKYTPPNMNTSSTTTSSYGTYSASPAFYISFVSSTPPAAGIYNNLYQIDAVGYGGSANSIAVVESTYAVQHYKTSEAAPTGSQPPLRNVNQGGT